MIRCPKCGTINADGSRFCSNCGFKLPQTRIRCPVCGAYNPVSNVFCEKCHARLASPDQEESEPGVEDLLSLPTRPPDDVPDWLRGLLDEHGTSELSPDDLIGTAAEDIVPSPEELPDWLADLAPAEEEAPVEEPPQAEEASVPDWLADLAPAEEEAPVEEASQAEEASVPDWLADLAPAEEEAPAEEPPQAEEASVPDWLAGLAPAEEEAPVEEPPQAEEASVPDWLADLAPAEEEAPVEEPPQAEEASVPDWLADLAPAEEEAPVEEPQAEVEGVPAPAEEPRPEAEIPAEPEEAVDEEDEEEDEETMPPVPPAAEPQEEIPDWLKTLGEGKEAPGGGRELPAGAVPDWLLRIKPPGTGPLPPLEEALGEKAEAEGGPARAEIPEWLQKLRPRSGETETPPPFAPGAAVGEGPLEGLSGVIPPALTVDMPSAYAWKEPETISPELREAARLWQSILERPRDRQRPVAGRRERRGWGDALVRLVTAAILIAVILAAIFGFVPPALLGKMEPPTQSGVGPLVQAVSALQPDDEVIVAFEYGAAQQGEMEAITYALIEHLMERQVRIVGVSTSAQGAALAEMTLERARRRYPDFADKVTDLGYLPGDATAVTQFLASSQAEGAQLLIVFAADTQRLRWWMEQNAAGPNLPLVAALNGATAPLVTPYLESRQVVGWMSGLVGANAYWQERGLPPDETPAAEGLSRRLQALALAHWMAAALILAGSAYYLFAGRREAP